MAPAQSGSVKLPPGFVLDDAPSLPAGFVLDSPASDNSAIQAAPQPVGEDPRLTRVRQLMGMTSPGEIGERLKGVAQTAGKIGLGALQWGQNIVGAHVTPTPTWLESGNPEQRVGQDVAGFAAAAAPAELTAGASLPMSAAGSAITGGLQADDPTASMAGAAIGGLLPVGGRAASKYIADHQIAERIYNRVAGVPGGRKGAEITMSTGTTKTMPANAVVDKTKTGLANLSDAVFARPNQVLRVKVQREFEQAGQAIESHLSQNADHFEVADVLPTEVRKMQSALRNVGLPTDPAELGQARLSAIQVHDLRSEIGNQINWNPNVYNEGNEAMKEGYFALGEQLDKRVHGIKPLNKRWQEAFLYRQALKQRLDEQLAGHHVPLSLAEKGILGAAGTGAGIEAYRGFRELH